MTSEDKEFTLSEILVKMQEEDKKGGYKITVYQHEVMPDLRRELIKRGCSFNGWYVGNDGFLEISWKGVSLDER